MAGESNAAHSASLPKAADSDPLPGRQVQQHAVAVQTVQVGVLEAVAARHLQAGSLQRACQCSREVDNGGHVSVVGSVKELGSWDVAQAPRLSQNGGDVWQGTLPLPLGQEVEFKFVVAGSQQEAVWEGIPNRTLKPESPLALTAQWDHTDLEWKKVAGEITRLPEEDVPAKTPFDDSARRNLKATLSRLVKDALAAQA
ncbi:hypothetical protein N2152v2_007842 [Parachlorella kessleri]